MNIIWQYNQFFRFPRYLYDLKSTINVRHSQLILSIKHYIKHPWCYVIYLRLRISTLCVRLKLIYYQDRDQDMYDMKPI